MATIAILGQAAEPAMPAIPSCERASLVICSPGSDVYELEGHAALRIVLDDGTDLAVNYGIFDFDSPNFIYRFVSGQTDYKVAAYSFQLFLNDYRRHGRQVVEYPLNLTADERARLFSLLATNLLPQNRVYRYNYVKDNCSTRPVRLIENAAGATIALRAPAATEGWTFRDAMRWYHRNYPWYQFGIDLALGPGIDYPISEHEKAFAPALLGEMLPQATLPDSLTATRRLVATPIVHTPAGAGGPADPTPWPLTPMAAALYLLAATVAIVAYDLSRRRISRWADAAYMAVAGLAGCMVAFLIFVSTHEATSPNYLLAWLNPLCLAVPLCIFIKRCARLLFCYEILNFVALFLLCILWPMTGQSANAAFWPLVAADMLLAARYIFIYAICAKRPTQA